MIAETFTSKEQIERSTRWILVIVIARIIRKRQDDIDAVLDREHQDPPAGDYLGRLGGGKMG